MGNRGARHEQSVPPVETADPTPFGSVAGRAGRDSRGARKTGMKKKGAEMEKLVAELKTENRKHIIFFIMDGLGGLPDGESGLTELQAARTPNLDALAAGGICGVLDPIGSGITPGSGPAHLALFGYDPVEYNIGRGVLSALGVDFHLKGGDVAARVNFCTVDGNGIITDRRAGRIPTEDNKRIVKKLLDAITLPDGVKWFMVTESEHRAAFVLRGKGLSDKIADTDPQVTGEKPLSAEALVPEAEGTAKILNGFLSQVATVLKDEQKANMILMRGFATLDEFPGMQERYGLRCAAVAQYPMYRGLARLVGMDVLPVPESLEAGVQMMKDMWDTYTFFYFHVKKTDSYGEDGNRDAKIHVIEDVDKLITSVVDLKPDVLVVTGDHSTPCILKSHSWHPVPVLLASDHCLRDAVQEFNEVACPLGGIGRMPMKSLMTLAMANAQKLKKFGA